MTFRTGTGILALASILVVSLSSCAVNELGDKPSELRGILDAAGSSAQANAQEAWVSHFQRNNAFVTINYEPTGSGAGRESFISGGVDLAGSDTPLSAEELAGEFVACAPGAKAIDIPVYLSPLAVIFNIDGVTELNLDASTLAKIFKGEITQWDSTEIQALNPGISLPGTGISAVHRSDDSGTTMNFVDYLGDAAPEVWSAPASDTFPYRGEAAQGNAGVVDAVTNGVGTIGYADASRAAGLDVAAIKVGDEFVHYTPEAAAAIIDVSPFQEGRADNDLAVEINHTTTESDAYPIVLVSYLIVCEDYANKETAALVKAYIEYVVSEAGQRDAARLAGSAPISASLSARIATIIAEMA